MDDALDIYYIFPKRWQDDHDVPAWIGNSIVNKTTIGARTGRRIGGNAPSKYLERIEANDQIAADDLDTILRSHDIDPLAVRRDDFPAFFTARFERLLKQIEDATGKPVNRSVDDNPYAGDESDPADDIRRVIAAGESKVVEFKSTGRKNLHTGEKNAAMEWSVLKSVAGFMNNSGGTLLVGVADDGAIVGIEEDYPFLGSKRNTDGWELWLVDLLTRSLGKAAATDVSLGYGEMGGLTVARIDVGPAARPVFASGKNGKGDVKEAFLVRISSSTQQLTGPEAHDYQRKRWPA